MRSIKRLVDRGALAIGLDRWQQLELLGLALTIPAFYLAVLEEYRAMMASAYLFAVAMVARAAAIESRAQPVADASRKPGWRPLYVLLLLALGASAAAPMGDAPEWLLIRLTSSLLVVIRLGELVRPYFWRGSPIHLMVVAIAVLGLSGLGFWWLEPRAENFADGLWLAFATAATVGYGDIVPSTPASKIFAGFVVLTGLAVLSLVTAAIAAAWVQTEERQVERDILRDLHQEMRRLHVELDALRAEVRGERRTLPDQASSPRAATDPIGQAVE